MLSVRVDLPADPPTHLFTRKDIEPVLNQNEELVVLSGYWPERAMIRSSVVLCEETLVAIHITCYPRAGFTEVWRYYALQEGKWLQRTWNQLPIASRFQILEAYKQSAHPFTSHPGNIPGQPGVSRAVKHGPTYLLLAVEERGLVSLANQQAIYTLGKQLRADRGWHHSYPDKEMLLLKWHQGAIAPTWITGPFLAGIVECEIGGNIRLAQGIVESEQLCPLHVVEVKCARLT